MNKRHFILLTIISVAIGIMLPFTSAYQRGKERLFSLIKKGAI